MAFDRASGAKPAQPEGLAPALRLQILGAEHSSLVAARSLAWNEVFSRAGMFLSTLSGAIVAIALAGQGSGFGQPFLLFALVILPVVLFLGVATFLRMSTSNWHDAQCVIGMNRIRGAYFELAPELERYFVMSGHDDRPGVTISMGQMPSVNPVLHLLASTPNVVNVVNSVLTAAIAGLALLAAGAVMPVPLAAAAVGFVASFVLHVRHARGMITRSQGSIQPLFPSPAEGR
jgi:hypothetical protein